MKKIWITGAEGHIGTALLELLEGVEYQLLPTDIHEYGTDDALGSSVFAASSFP